MTPKASRPQMPGYGLAAEQEGEGLLEWPWAETRLEESHNYWLSTARPTGRPHCMPVWAVWHDGRLFFSTGSESVKARNLRLNPACTISTESATEAVILEGAAQRIANRPLEERIQAIYQAKYGHAYPADSSLFAVKPEVAFGFIERGTRFTKTATRWRF